MKGIILAGGKGTRLYPITTCVSKQLLPIYDKPMIYYSLSVLMLAKIREILIISTEEDTPIYEKLLKDGSKIGLKISYAVQKEPKGIAEAFIIGEEFIAEDSVMLVLGDNVFHGNDFSKKLWMAIENNKGATIFGYKVSDPREYGVVEFDKDKNVLSIEEKPEKPKSNYAVPGIYVYDNDVVEIAKHIKPSSRGELEITAVNNEYLNQKRLKVALFERGIAWLDTGTVDNLLNAAKYVEIVQERQGSYISCIEEIAYRRGMINAEQLKALGEEIKKTEYGQYILSIAKGELE